MSVLGMTEWQVAEEVIGAIRATGGKLLLHGAPGTGKTTWAMKVCGSENKEPVRLNLHQDKPAAELTGMYQPQPTEFGTKFEWVHGLAVRAMLEGRGLVVDEIDKGEGDVVDILYAILDDFETASLTLPTGEIIRPQEGFFVVATMNGEPHDLMEGIQDRFHVILEINEPHPDSIAALPDDLQRAARKSLNANRDRSISMRGWHAFAKIRNKVASHEVAAAAVFGQRAGDVLDTLKLIKAEDENGTAAVADGIAPGGAVVGCPCDGCESIRRGE